ncbi:MAG TPA: polyprenyl synthetase family protein [Actinomycetes bacterium]|nr:polyprenyl synthetase family protein [Actinomycetes bacterium]
MSVAGSPGWRGDGPARLRDGLAEVERHTRARLARVEDELAVAVSAADPFVQEAAGVLITAGGKRFRPTCVLLAGHFGDPDEPRLVPTAVAIELTHLSTLYHDDVIDEAELRRGTRSANARYGNVVAILTGDYLFARASEVTAGLGGDATRVLARTVARLVQGQIREVRGPRPGEDPVAHYLAVLAEKTGALIGAACRLGAEVAGAEPAQVTALAEFGERMGVAFQLGDDLLDITEDPDASGKLPGTDLREGVRTLPVLYLLRGGGPDAAAVARVLGDDTPAEAAVAEALAILRGSEAFEQARHAAQAEVHRAKAALAFLPDSPARQALEQLADRVLDRDH